MGLLSAMILGQKGKRGIGKMARNNNSGIMAFRYNFIGSIGANSYSYIIEKKGEKYIFTYDAMQHREFENMTLECDAGIIEQIESLYKKLRIAEWNGFDKYNTRVLDGDGFSVSILFNDGKELYAHGSNVYPAGYSDFKNQLDDIIDPLTERILTQKRRELISKGINGNLNHIMVNIIQHGSSGKDSYSFFLIEEKYRENNCEIKLDSLSGKYFPIGKNSYYFHLPLSEADLPAVRKILDENNILEWYDFDEAADDYNNSEWFQICFGFDDKLSISACGTKHPDHYDSFKDSFLKWMKTVMQRFIIDT